MKKRNYFKFTRPGLALEIAVFAVVLFMIMGLCLLSISSNGRVFAIRQGSAITARAACDAGITKAIQLLKNEYAKNPTTYNSNPSSLCSDPNITGQNVANETFTLSTPAASYSYTVSYDSTNKWYQIDCTGTAGPWRKTAHARVIPRPYNVFFGMGLGKTLTAKNNDKFLSYPATNGLLIKTNSTATGAIDLSKSTIEGDVAVGDGGDPSKVITNPSSVKGETYASANIVYPPITAPTGPAGPAPNNGSCTITAAPPSGKAYQYSTINASGNITINSNLGDVAIYVSGSMNISNITVGKGSTLLLYIGQDLTGKNNVAITNNNLDTNNKNEPDPTHVLIFGTAGVTSVQNITLKNNADIYACIYAPNADIQLKNNGNVYGAIVANSFTFKNNATFGYDTAFSDFDALTLTNFGFAPNHLDVLSWWE